MPKYTLAAKGDCGAGGKVHKSRVTVLLQVYIEIRLG